MVLKWHGIETEVSNFQSFHTEDGHIEENQESSQEAFENVHARVVMENCPTKNCDYKVVYDLVTKEHNMRANIANVSIDHQF